MYFYILKDQHKIKRAKDRFTESFRKKTKNLGRVVSYRMPAYENQFKELERTIAESSRFHNISDRYCLIEGKHSSFMEFIPASSYYSRAFHRAHMKILGLNWTIQEISKTLKEIDSLYQNERKINSATGQHYFELNREVYQIQNSVAGFFMYTKSILDTLATTMYMFYEGQQYNSFSDYKKAIVNNPNTDKEMADYLNNELSWYKELRDFRDYWAHIGIVEISFREGKSNDLTIVTNGQHDLFHLLCRIQQGLDEYIDFFCKHFIKRIKKV